MNCKLISLFYFYSKPKSKNDHLEFIMEGINEKDEKIIFGNKIFPINNIKNQDEYELEIIIPEKNNEKKPLAQINCKIFFFWSDFLLYDEKRKKLEKKLINLENAINKLKLYLNEINEIYQLNENKVKKKSLELPTINEGKEILNINNLNDNMNNDSYILQNNSNFNLYSNNDLYNYQIQLNQNNSNENEINDNIIVEDIKKEKESFLIGISLRNNKMLFRFVIILGFLTSFYRSDFPNQIGGILFLFGIFYINVIKDNYEKIIFYLKNIYKGVIFLLFYDLIWILLNFKNTILEYNKDEILMKKISLILAFCNVIIKLIICFNLIFEIKKYKNR